MLGGDLLPSRPLLGAPLSALAPPSGRWQKDEPKQLRMIQVTDSPLCRLLPSFFLVQNDRNRPHPGGITVDPIEPVPSSLEWLSSLMSVAVAAAGGG